MAREGPGHAGPAGLGGIGNLSSFPGSKVRTKERGREPPSHKRGSSPGKAAAHPPSMPILSTKIIIVFGLREASTYQFREDQTQ